MRVLLCTCAKNENNYIKEWVEHYQQLGFTNIVIYDNNDIEGETFADVLADYIKSGYVIIKNVRGKKGAQIPSFNDCYQTIAKEYDWVAFFDVDEFLEIDAGLKIDEFIQQPKFDNFNSICVCWKVFDDSNIIRVIDNNYSVKRFTHYISKDKNQNKKIVKTKIHDGVIVNSAHTFAEVDYMTQKVPEITQFVFSCNTLGQAVPNGVTIKNNTWECARLNHYRFKTIEEYITNKAPKGYATAWKNYGKDWLTIDTFFIFNDKTPEKVRFIKDYYANKK